MTMTNFKLVEPGEAETLLEFMQRFYEVDNIDIQEQVSRWALVRFFESDTNGRIWWILEGGQRVGYVAITFCFSLEFGGPTAVVDELYLEESHRGRGIGFEALKFVEAFCRDRGMLALHLEVDRENVRAQRLYQKAGYIDRNNYLLTKWISDGSP